ncbi:MAG: hypothetical protein Q4D65_05420 [Peptostreptococcaceae bacterium]|nr:hypothetical protein [Peptostreptococcaceae bacterium]
MQVFNLTSLNISQEVPRVLFKPINMNSKYIFFEKLLTGLDDTWSEGIWGYDINSHEMNRVDQGQHVSYKELYDFDTPQIFWNGTSRVDPDAMYFATITELDEEEFIEFYEIDLLSGVQRNILGFRFAKDSFVYKSMDLLAPGYLLFRLSYNVEFIDVDFYDDVYLLDVKEKKYYSVNDETFKINAGSIIVSGSGENARIFLEEYYLDEQEQYDLITSEEVELAYELHDSIDPNHIFKNTIKTTTLENFITQIKAGADEITMEVLDEQFMEGAIRLIGETNDFVYYKKLFYDFVLKKKGDFMSLRKIGSYEVYKIHKESLEKSFVRDVHDDSEIKTNSKRAYIINDSRFHSKIEDFDTGELVYDYKKRFVGRVYEEVADIVDDEYLIVHLDSDDPRIASYMIVDAKSDEMMIAGHDVLVLEDHIFVI